MAQQHAAGMLHRGDVLSLAVVQFGQAQQVQQAQNAVQGGPHLMAHHGDHARLGLFARDGAVTGLDQFGLLGRASGHVAHEGDHQRSVLSSGDRHGQFDGDDPARLVPGGGLHDIGPAGARAGGAVTDPGQNLAHLGTPVVRGQQVDDVGAHGLGPVISVDALCCGVETQDPPIGARHQDCVDRRLEQRIQAIADSRDASVSFARAAHHRGQDHDAARQHHEQWNDQQRQGGQCAGHTLAAQRGFFGEKPHPLQRHLPDQGHGGVDDGHDPGQTRDQSRVIAVDHRHGGVQPGLDRLQRGRDAGFRAQVIIGPPLLQRLDARIEDVEPLPQILRLIRAGTGRGQQQRGTLQGKNLDLGLGQEPLGVVRGGGPHLVDLTARIDLQQPDDQPQGQDHATEEGGHHPDRPRDARGMQVGAHRVDHRTASIRTSCQMLRA